MHHTSPASAAPPPKKRSRRRPPASTPHAAGRTRSTHSSNEVHDTERRQQDRRPPPPTRPPPPPPPGLAVPCPRVPRRVYSCAHRGFARWQSVYRRQVRSGGCKWMGELYAWHGRGIRHLPGGQQTPARLPRILNAMRCAGVARGSPHSRGAQRGKQTWVRVYATPQTRRPSSTIHHRDPPLPKPHALTPPLPRRHEQRRQAHQQLGPRFRKQRAPIRHHRGAHVPGPDPDLYPNPNPTPTQPHPGDSAKPDGLHAVGRVGGRHWHDRTARTKHGRVRG